MEDARPIAPTALAAWLDAVRDDETLWAPTAFARRTALLDRLEHWLPPGAGDAKAITTPDLMRAKTLRDRLESTQAQAFAVVRARILGGDGTAAVKEAVAACRLGAGPPMGDGYDALDAWASGVLQVPEPGPPGVALDAEMVAYQPTPARHVVDMVERLAMDAGDTLVDLGAGLGRVPMLVALLSPARAVGIEIDPALVASARAGADALRLSRVRFVAADARGADLGGGTVFYLYTPFRGALMRAVLDALHAQARWRPVRVVGFGPCTAVLAGEAWLRADGSVAADRVAIFHAGAPH